MILIILIEKLVNIGKIWLRIGLHVYFFISFIKDIICNQSNSLKFLYLGNS